MGVEFGRCCVLRLVCAKWVHGDSGTGIVFLVQLFYIQPNSGHTHCGIFACSRDASIMTTLDKH